MVYASEMFLDKQQSIIIAQLQEYEPCVQSFKWFLQLCFPMMETCFNFSIFEKLGGP